MDEKIKDLYEEFEEEFGEDDLSSPTRTIHSITQKKLLKFLAYFADKLNVTEAAKVAKLTRKTLYDIKNSCPKFAAAWERAEDYHLDRVDAEIASRAFDRDDDKSATLLIFDKKSRIEAKLRKEAANDEKLDAVLNTLNSWKTDPSQENE